MSNEKLQLLSPLFLRYQTDYEKNPRSRVFAPLAEMYRKVGMIEKAMEILVHGIKYNPDYIMGYLGLTFCYFDLKQYRLAYDTIKKYVDSHRDNIRLQKLFVDICVELNYTEEALETCKYLVFINPRDAESVANLALLEDKISNKYKHNHNPIIFEDDSRSLTHIDNVFSDEDDEFDSWKPLSIGPKVELKNHSINDDINDDIDEWKVQKVGEEKTSSNFRSPTKEIERIETKIQEKIDTLKTISLVETELEDKNTEEYEELSFIVKTDAVEKKPTFVSIEPTHSIDISKIDEAEENVVNIDSLPKVIEAQAPLITHTLVDLYCGQGHFNKALDLLDKILQLNPQDKKSIDKKIEIEGLILGNTTQSKIEKAKAKIIETDDRLLGSEDDGRNDLMSFFDEQVGSKEINDLINDVVLEDKTPKSEVAQEDLKEIENSFNKAIESFKQKLADNKGQDKLSDNEAINQLKDDLVSLSQHPEILGEDLHSNESNNVVDTAFSQRSEVQIRRLSHFLQAIQKRALDYQSRF